MEEKGREGRKDGGREAGREDKEMGGTDGREGGKFFFNLAPREGQRLARARPAAGPAEGPVLLPAWTGPPGQLGAQVAAECSKQQASEAQHQGERGERGGKRQQCPSRVLRQPRASAQLWVQPVGARSSQLRAARLKLEQQLRAQRRQHGCWDAQQDHRGQHPAAVRAGHVRGPAEPGGSGGVCEIFEEQGGWGNSGSPEGGGVAGVSESWELQGSRGASRSGKDETPRKLRTKSFFLPHGTLRAPPPGLQVLGAGPARGGAEKGRGSP